MPPTVRFTRDAVLHAACQLMRREGMEALNARAIAKGTRRLNAADFPPVHQHGGFAPGADSLRRAPVSGTRGGGYGAVRLALYSALHDVSALRPRRAGAVQAAVHARPRRRGQYSDQTNFDLVFNIIKKETPLDDETALRFFERTWLFIHGLAVCIATKYILVRMKDTSSVWSRKPTTPPSR